MFRTLARLGGRNAVRIDAYVDEKSMLFSKPAGHTIRRLWEFREQSPSVFQQFQNLFDALPADRDGGVDLFLSGAARLIYR